MLFDIHTAMQNTDNFDLIFPNLYFPTHPVCLAKNNRMGRFASLRLKRGAALPVWLQSDAKETSRNACPM